jgi:hypothetical protein
MKRLVILLLIIVLYSFSTLKEVPNFSLEELITLYNSDRNKIEESLLNKGFIKKIKNPFQLDTYYIPTTTKCFCEECFNSLYSYEINYDYTILKDIKINVYNDYFQSNPLENLIEEIRLSAKLDFIDEFKGVRREYYNYNEFLFYITISESDIFYCKRKKSTCVSLIKRKLFKSE